MCSRDSVAVSKGGQSDQDVCFVTLSYQPSHLVSSSSLDMSALDSLVSCMHTTSADGMSIDSQAMQACNGKFPVSTRSAPAFRYVKRLFRLPNLLFNTARSPFTFQLTIFILRDCRDVKLTVLLALTESMRPAWAAMQLRFDHAYIWRMLPESQP